jgi:hypothetical protein
MFLKIITSVLGHPALTSGDEVVGDHAKAVRLGVRQLRVGGRLRRVARGRGASGSNTIKPDFFCFTPVLLGPML